MDKKLEKKIEEFRSDIADSEASAIVLVAENDDLRVGLKGKEHRLVEMIATAIESDPIFAKIVKTAVEFAE